MDVYSFGANLLSTGDLDPVYIMLADSGIDQATRYRWLLAYWSFYHCGVASRIAEKEGCAYWHTMRQAYHEKWPRGAERRYFRGEKSLAAINWLEEHSKWPEHFGMWWTDGKTFTETKRRVCEAPLFGDWISFKISDMAERVVGKEMHYDNFSLGIYKDPRQGAALVKHGDWQIPITDQELEEVVGDLTWQFRKFTAPPSHDRKVNMQEVETILCKYKSHVKGHYPLGKDTREITHGMKGWGDLADELARWLPSVETAD